MRKIRAAVVGYGDRGGIYCSYALRHPEELEIVSVVEPNTFRRQSCGEIYAIPTDMRFASLDAFLAAKPTCDIVINATMDELHIVTALPLMEAGYDLLLEKPITADPAELLKLQRAAHQYDRRVFICHVLRYTPFYTAVKKKILSGAIGKIISIEQNEHVWAGHFLTSFVRGKWRSEAACGSGLLLAKTCHDLDLMCWLNGSTYPSSVVSIGARALFQPDQAPVDAAEYCIDCPHWSDCVYSAKHYHIDHDYMPFIAFAQLDKPYDQITREEKLAYLKHADCGKCCFFAGGDLVDRQAVAVRFEDGSLGTLNLIGASTVPERNLHIVGTHGEIKGLLEDRAFTVKYLRPETEDYFTEERVTVEIPASLHSGGDECLMRDLCAYLNGDRSSVSMTTLDDSIAGHMTVYAAERARKERRTVDIKDFSEGRSK